MACVQIAGRDLTAAELRTLDILAARLKEASGDSGAGPGHSPAGDGGWVPILDLFPRYPGSRFGGGARSNADRQAVRRLHRSGVLAACEIAMWGECLKLSPRPIDDERAIAAMRPEDRERLVRHA